MKTEKEFAEYLLDKFLDAVINMVDLEHPPLMTISLAKECAKTTIDLMIAEHTFESTEYANRRFLYLSETKKELEKL